MIWHDWHGRAWTVDEDGFPVNRVPDADECKCCGRAGCCGDCQIDDQAKVMAEEDL